MPRLRSILTVSDEAATRHVEAAIQSRAIPPGVVAADLAALLQQIHLAEHHQDRAVIARIRERYGFTL